jgi:hypothetical protein
LVFGLTLPADATPVVRKTLEAFAFDGGEATDGHRGKNAMLGAALLEGKHRVARGKILYRMIIPTGPKA